MSKVCTASGEGWTCDKPIKCKGLCNAHYLQTWKGRALTALDSRKTRPVRVCSVEGCGTPVAAKGWCGSHYSQHQHDRAVTPINHRQTHDEHGQRICTVCGEARPASEYHPDPRTKRDGLRSACKRCESNTNTEYRAAHKGDPMDRARRNRNSREWTRRNRAKARSARQAWERANPDKVRDLKKAKDARRRARMKGATAEVFSEAELHAYWRSNDIDPDRCWYCPEPAEHVDHFQPLAKGGEHSRANLVPACVHHNCSKQARNPFEFIRPMVDRTMVLFTVDGPEITLYRKEEDAA